MYVNECDWKTFDKDYKALLTTLVSDLKDQLEKNSI